VSRKTGLVGVAQVSVTVNLLVLTNSTTDTCASLTKAVIQVHLSYAY